ncbi:MAG TPA: stage II sporulation protein M [Terriglobia bacterium]|jgi:uncharacterized membrane protein SpoIIM required for sporulation/uncharacterized RDD family membrane protein YckC
MDEHISVVTPDHFELDFDIAGVGSRFLALLADSMLIGGIVIVLILAAVVMGIAGLLTVRSQATGSWVLAVAVIAYFIVTWGYFLFFEALNNGQTPGKKWAGIRVVKDDGLPVGWRESALRNLVRVADTLPPPACVVGALAILISKRGKRLGDLLAGTIVVVDIARLEPTERVSRWGTTWILKAERGRVRTGIMAGGLRIEANSMQVIERFLARRESLPVAQREALAWRIASPLLSAVGEDPKEIEKRPERFHICEQALQTIMKLADSAPKASSDGVTEDAADAKRRQWRQFNQRIQRFEGAGKRDLWRLRPDELAGIIEEYRTLGCDLSRARSMGRSSAVVRHLNNIAVRAHGVLYRKMLDVKPVPKSSWLKAFPIAVRSHLGSVGLSALLLFGPSFVSFFAVQVHPELGYDLVPAGFLDFQPARRESMHDIPTLARPVVASTILTNNIQVTLLSFAFGLTAGVGTAFVLITNGIQLGAVAGWMTSKGNSSSLWGWIMPHGGTELLAITLAGAAGLMLARAVIAPGEVRRAVALRRVAVSALTIELGVMVMLIFAGLIEGFVSPSSIGYGARIAVLATSIVFWFGYLGLSGTRN